MIKFSTSTHIIRVIKRQIRYVARTGHLRNEYKILVGNPERKRPLEGHKRRYEGGGGGVTKRRVWVGNWSYWILTGRNYKQL
jgi:hypothetical protein